MTHDPIVARCDEGKVGPGDWSNPVDEIRLVGLAERLCVDFVDRRLVAVLLAAHGHRLAHDGTRPSRMAARRSASMLPPEITQAITGRGRPVSSTARWVSAAASEAAPAPSVTSR